MAWRGFYFHFIKGLTFSSGILPSGFSGHDVCMRCSLAWSHWRGEGGTHWWTREFRAGPGDVKEAINQRMHTQAFFYMLNPNSWRWMVQMIFPFLIWGDFLAWKIFPCWWASTSINPASKIISWVSFFLMSESWRITCYALEFLQRCWLVCTARPYHFKWSKQIQAQASFKRQHNLNKKLSMTFGCLSQS